MSPPPALSDLSDQEVAALARQGHEAAYSELVRRHQPTVYALIFRMVHERELAEDLTQETFFKVFASLDSARQESKFSAWVYRIAANTALDHIRRKEMDTHQPLENTPDSTTPRNVQGRAITSPTPSDPTPVGADTRKALEQAIKRLRGNYRRCVQLRFLEERSYDDIAEILGLPVGSVKGYMHRAKQELRRMPRMAAA